MRRLWSILPVMAAVAITWAATSATGVAQSSIPNGVFVKNSEGLLWLVLDGQRVKIPVWGASDEEIAAIPVPDLWAVMNGQGAIVAGDRPSWFGGGQFAAFAGRWARRDASITIRPDGSASLWWKTGACLSEAEIRPCDRIIDRALLPGGRAAVVFSAVSGLSASGVIVESTHELFPPGDVTLTKVAPDLVKVQQPGRTVLWLCRPPREENGCDV